MLPPAVLVVEVVAAVAVEVVKSIFSDPLGCISKCVTSHCIVGGSSGGGGGGGGIINVFIPTGMHQ